jgi:hypothetical protein
MLRKTLFWGGWVLIAAYVVIFGAQIYLMQDLPPVSAVKWIVFFATFALIYAARDRDDVTHYHLPH